MSDDANETPEAEADETAAATDVTDPAPVDDTTDPADDAAEDAAGTDEAEAPAPTAASTKAKSDAKSDAKAKADAVVAERKTPERRVVTSRRVTPKAGAKPAAAASTTSKARDAKKTESVVSRAPAVTPQQVYAKGPSPWYVPAIMFGLLIVGALIIMTNYMGVFGDASNIRLVIGLGFILGGIVTATQYR